MSVCERELRSRCPWRSASACAFAPSPSDDLSGNERKWGLWNMKSKIKSISQIYVSFPPLWLTQRNQTQLSRVECP
jgi:hypothetical protein